MSAPVRFRVYTDHPYCCPAWIWVAVYDDVEHLRKDARRHRARQDFSQAGAVFQSPRYRFSRDGETQVLSLDPVLDSNGRAYGGVMRILREDGAGVIAHESTHAAASIYQRRINYDALTLGDDNAMEEEFAYLVGEFVRGICNKMIEHKIWS